MFVLFVFKIYPYFQFKIAHIGAAELSWIVRAFVIIMFLHCLQWVLKIS